jgi:8-oxo-dGTP pyrophosphatase MutT (NUDIX family)
MDYVPGEPIISIGNNISGIKFIHKESYKAAAGCCIYYNNLILLGRKSSNDLWGFAKGKYDLTDLTLTHTASRELLEEFHIHIAPKFLQEYHHKLINKPFNNGKKINYSRYKFYHQFLIYFVPLPYFIDSNVFLKKAYKVYDHLTLYDYKWFTLDYIKNNKNLFESNIYDFL